MATRDTAASDIPVAQRWRRPGRPVSGRMRRPPGIRPAPLARRADRGSHRNPSRQPGAAGGPRYGPAALVGGQLRPLAAAAGNRPKIPRKISCPARGGLP